MGKAGNGTRLQRTRPRRAGAPSQLNLCFTSLVHTIERASNVKYEFRSGGAGFLDPITTGAALGLTFAGANLLCAIAFGLWPDTALDFVNAWFHTVDLAVLKQAPKSVSAGGYAYGVAGLAVVGFVLGAGFASFYNWILRLRSEP